MHRLTAAAVAAAAIVLVACSPDAADFKSEAEKYIKTREFSEAVGLLRFTDAECEEPESTAEDTRFTCTATADDGGVWQFSVDITGETDLRVITPGIQLSAGPGESIVPVDSSPDSTPSTTPASTPPTTAASTADSTTTTSPAASSTAPTTAPAPTTTTV